MSDEQTEKIKGLPDNAYTELKEGEEYQPVMSPYKDVPEVNLWSVSIGLLMAILFSAAAAYLGLKSDKCSSSYQLQLLLWDCQQL